MLQPLTRERAKIFLEGRFAQFNAQFFEGKLPTAPTCFFNCYRDPETQEERLAGYTGDAQLRTRLIIITDDALRNGENFAADSLLHEMIHHAQVFLLKVDHRSHGQSFVETANRIADVLRLAHVEPDSHEASCWPQTLR